MSSTHGSAAAVILAGGAGRRLGGVDKATLNLGPHRLIDIAIARVNSWHLPVLISTRAAPPWHDTIAATFVRDDPAHEGPVAGVIAAFRATAPETAVLVSLTVDCPQLPDDLAARLIDAAARSKLIAVAACAGRRHHLLAAWPHAAMATIEKVVGAGERAVHRAQAAYGTIDVSWPDAAADRFLNLNTPDELARAGLDPDAEGSRP